MTNRCCGKDLGPIADHEGPSEEDMERFGGATRVCPECKTEVYDEATVCHSCGRVFTAADNSKGLPTWAICTMVGVAAAFVLGLVSI